MDALARLQFPAEMLRHYVTVFQVTMPVRGNDAITAWISRSGTSGGLEPIGRSWLSVPPPAAIVPGTVAAPIDRFSAAIDIVQDRFTAWRARLDEAVIRRVVGGPPVMREQLRHLERERIEYAEETA